MNIAELLQKIGGLGGSPGMTIPGFGGTNVTIPGGGLGFPGATPGYGDDPLAQARSMGIPAAEKPQTLMQKIAAGLGRMRDNALPVDPAVAGQMSPEAVKQMRKQALLQSGLGMIGASSQGGNFGTSLATGLGQGINGFNRNVDAAYDRGVEAQQQRRRDQIQTASDRRYEEEQQHRAEREKVSDQRDQRDFDATQQYRKDSLKSLEARAAMRNKPTGTTLSDSAVDFAAKRLLNGEPASKVLANFGRGAQGAQNITAVQNRLADLAAEGGVSPQLMAVLTQELASDSRARLELGAREGKIASRVEEAKQFAKIAGDASVKVPRGEFVPISRLLQFSDSQLSNPELAAFKAANVSLINAYAAAVGGGVPTVHDKEAAEKMLSTAQSPEAYQAVVNQLITEMDAALAAPRNVMQQMREHELGSGLGHPANPATPWMPSTAPPAASGPSPLAPGWSIRPR